MWVNEKFRQNFPIADSAKFMGSRTPDELDTFLDDFRAQLLDRLSGAQFEELFTEFVMASNQMTHIPKVVLPNQFLLKDNIGMDTEFELPIGQKIILKSDGERNAGVIYSRGIKIHIEGAKQELLSAIFHQDPNSISGDSVKSKCPDLKDEAITETLLKLVEEGVIQMKRSS